MFPFQDLTQFPPPDPELFPLSILPLPIFYHLSNHEPVLSDASHSDSASPPLVLHDVSISDASPSATASSPVASTHVASLPYDHSSSSLSSASSRSEHAPSLTHNENNTIPVALAYSALEIIDISINADSSTNVRPKRKTKAPKYLSEYHYYLNSEPSLSDSPFDTHFILYPISFVISYDSLSFDYSFFILSITTDMEPKSFSQAIKSVH